MRNSPRRITVSRPDISGIFRRSFRLLGTGCSMLGPAMGSNPLPTGNAFLVQLAEEVDPAHGELTGRVEHLESGLRARFGSPEELFAQFASMLARRRGANARTERQEA